MTPIVAVQAEAAFHIPRNNALDGLKPEGADSARYWTTYVSQWTAGNHLRTLTCAAAALLSTIAAGRGG